MLNISAALSKVTRGVLWRIAWVARKMGTSRSCPRQAVAGVPRYLQNELSVSTFVKEATARRSFHGQPAQNEGARRESEVLTRVVPVQANALNRLDFAHSPFRDDQVGVDIGDSVPARWRSAGRNSLGPASFGFDLESWRRCFQSAAPQRWPLKTSPARFNERPRSGCRLALAAHTGCHTETTVRSQRGHTICVGSHGGHTIGSCKSHVEL